MAGNIHYFFYSGFLLVALIVVVVILGIKKDFGPMKKMLLFLIPLVVLCEVYFWNAEFNNYVQSYLFSSKVYECGDSAELASISIPLPDRTVFKGKADGCSPFYFTYADERTFTNFYAEELKKVKNSEAIKTFHPVEKGFTLELRSGSTIDIFLNEGNRSMLIDYNPKT